MLTLCAAHLRHACKLLTIHRTCDFRCIDASIRAVITCDEACRVSCARCSSRLTWASSSPCCWPICSSRNSCIQRCHLANVADIVTLRRRLTTACRRISEPTRAVVYCRQRPKAAVAAMRCRRLMTLLHSLSFLCLLTANKCQASNVLLQVALWV